MEELEGRCGGTLPTRAGNIARKQKSRNDKERVGVTKEQNRAGDNHDNQTRWMASRRRMAKEDEPKRGGGERVARGWRRGSVRWIRPAALVGAEVMGHGLDEGAMSLLCGGGCLDRGGWRMNRIWMVRRPRESGWASGAAPGTWEKLGSC